jgi:acyl-CoA reductase-like NAD-dependent aldehyde dehydrogenase
MASPKQQLRGNLARAEQLLKRDWKMLVGGELVAACSLKTYDTYNPADGEFLAAVPFAQKDDVDRAVEAAQAAFESWRRTSTGERVQYVQRLAAVLRANATDLGLMDSIDSGNPITAMVGDVNMAAGIVSYFAGIATEVKGATVPATAANLHLTLREPYGVVGQIFPYNHPILYAGSKPASALLMGNTVILKAADQTPLASLYLAELIKDVFPPGVLNIITGSGQVTGDALVRHPQVKRLALTGSVETGMRIQHAAAEVAIKQITCELGGKNPMIVLQDADIDKAVEGVTRGMNFHWSQGQSCGSTSRLFLHRDLHDEFIEKLRNRVRQIKIGMPIDPATEMGCLVSRQQYEKVLKYIELGHEQGAVLVAGGKRPEGAEFANGFFVEPTVFDRVHYDMRIAQEEIFGPVLSVLTWHNEEDVIRQANSVSYGLTGAIWTKDIDKAFRMAKALDTGLVWINGSQQHFAGVPFGGHKNSGNTSEESIEELLGYTQVKSINVMLSE